MAGSAVSNDKSTVECRRFRLVCRVSRHFIDLAGNGRSLNWILSCSSVNRDATNPTAVIVSMSGVVYNREHLSPYPRRGPRSRFRGGIGVPGLATMLWGLDSTVVSS